MIPQIMKNRPPHVRFETRPREHRGADGSITFDMIDYALITPTGTKDVHEKVVTDWFKQMADLTRMERWDETWTEHYQKKYELWKKGEELPLEGTPIAAWPVATSAQITVLKAIRVYTVEDLAQANEETVGRLGMGGRRLKQMAMEWIAAKGGDTAALVSRLDALQTTNEALVQRNKEQETRLRALEAVIQAQGGTRTALHPQIDRSQLREIQDDKAEAEMDKILGA